LPALLGGLPALLEFYLGRIPIVLTRILQGLIAGFQLGLLFFQSGQRLLLLQASILGQIAPLAVDVAL